jgi:hypothetical protein
VLCYSTRYTVQYKPALAAQELRFLVRFRFLFLFLWGLLLRPFPPHAAPAASTYRQSLRGLCSNLCLQPVQYEAAWHAHSTLTGCDDLTALSVLLCLGPVQRASSVSVLFVSSTANITPGLPLVLPRRLGTNFSYLSTDPLAFSHGQRSQPPLRIIFIGAELEGLRGSLPSQAQPDGYAPTSQFHVN